MMPLRLEMTFAKSESDGSPAALACLGSVYF